MGAAIAGEAVGGIDAGRHAIADGVAASIAPDVGVNAEDAAMPAPCEAQIGIAVAAFPSLEG